MMDAVALALSVLAIASGASSLTLMIWSDKRVRRELHYARIERVQHAWAVTRLAQDLGEHTGKGDEHIWRGVQADIDHDSVESQPYTT